MTANQRIYVATHGEAKRLIRAHSPAAARNHIARHSIAVEVASQNDIVALVSVGRLVEETTSAPVRLEAGEAA